MFTSPLQSEKFLLLVSINPKQFVSDLTPTAHQYKAERNPEFLSLSTDLPCTPDLHSGVGFLAPPVI